MERTHPIYAIITFWRTRKRMPTYSEVSQLCGYRSTNAAYKLVARLLEQGLLAKDTAGKLLPTSHFSGAPLLGDVGAGFPSPAEEELGDTMDLNEFLIANKEATYILRVTGDSMADAGILPGDLVLVERTHDFKDGDIVIAEIDHEFTMKYLRKKGRKFYLEAANKRYKPLYPQEELKVVAVVRAVIRKY
jgi:SOS regulatory protein LexA